MAITEENFKVNIYQETGELSYCLIDIEFDAVTEKKNNKNELKYMQPLEMCFYYCDKEYNPIYSIWFKLKNTHPLSNHIMEFMKVSNNEFENGLTDDEWIPLLKEYEDKYSKEKYFYYGYYSDSKFADKCAIDTLRNRYALKCKYDGGNVNYKVIKDIQSCSRSVVGVIKNSIKCKVNNVIRNLGGTLGQGMLLKLIDINVNQEMLHNSMYDCEIFNSIVKYFKLCNNSNILTSDVTLIIDNPNVINRFVRYMARGLNRITELDSIKMSKLKGILKSEFDLTHWVYVSPFYIMYNTDTREIYYIKDYITSAKKNDDTEDDISMKFTLDKLDVIVNEEYKDISSVVDKYYGRRFLITDLDNQVRKFLEKEWYSDDCFYDTEFASTKC